MFSSNLCKLAESEGYRKMVVMLCKACSYDENSRGIKLLEEAASSISLAIEKLNELEQFIADSEVKDEKRVNSHEDNSTNVMESSYQLRQCNKSPEGQANGTFTIYFSVNENVAESHVIDAFDKAGFTGFVLDLLVNRINFAYGFVTFNDETAFQNVTTSNNKIYIGNTEMRIIPRTGASVPTDKETIKRTRKNKQKYNKKMKCNE